MRLTHVRLLVARFDECLRFYRDVMGFPVAWGEEGGRYADLDAGEGVTLALFARDAMARAVGASGLPVEAGSQDRVALVFGADDLDGLTQRLRDREVALVNEPQERPEWGIRVVHFRDPDANLIEAYSDLPRERWTDRLREDSSGFEGTQFSWSPGPNRSGFHQRYNGHV
jgi:catechol 2,3-dioxygenase-like lactoylglutathione lyase family enzyme